MNGSKLQRSLYKWSDWLVDWKSPSQKHSLYILEVVGFLFPPANILYMVSEEGGNEFVDP